MLRNYQAHTHDTRAPTASIDSSNHIRLFFNSVFQPYKNKNKNLLHVSEVPENKFIFFPLQPLLPLTHTSRHAHDQSLSYTQYVNTRIFPVVRGVEGQAGNFRTPPLPEEIERKGIVKGKGGRASEKEEICVEPHHFLVIVLGLLE